MIQSMSHSADTQPIRFGTSGFRGVLGETFTAERSAALVAAVARHVARQRPAARVLVAHDTRFFADRFAEAAARIVTGAGAAAVRAAGPVPTPVASHAVRAEGCAAGLVFTASHNPPEYLGLKVLDAAGCAAPRALTREFEREAARLLALGAPVERAPADAPVDCRSPYLESLLAVVDQEALSRAGMVVFFDALHGTGAGVLDEALRRVGVTVEARRTSPDPRFGGIAPDPVAEHLGALCGAVSAATGPRLGLATDGDADRYGVVDSDGRVLSATEAVALLVDHLAASGRVTRGVAISVATGSLVEAVAREHGLHVERHPIGFGHLSEALRTGGCDAAGEESGGFAFGPALDKDGILAGCLLAECVAATGEALGARLESLYARHGRSACGRAAVASDAGSGKLLERLAQLRPARFDDAAVQDVELGDGVRLLLEDGFLLVRASGTEPVVRLYAEAPDAARLARRLAAGADWLRDAG